MQLDVKNIEKEVKYTKLLDKEKVFVNININGSEWGIGRVISISSKPVVETSLVNNGSIEISGKIISKVLIKDSKDDFRVLECATNYTTHIKNHDVNQDSCVYAIASLDSILNIQASDQSVNFSCNILVQPTIVLSQKFKVIESLSNVVQQKSEEFSYMDLIASNTQDFELNFELDLPTNISKILSVESLGNLKSIEAKNDIINLNGEIYYNMLYLSADETPKLKSQRYAQEFNYEILAENIQATDLVDCQLQTGSVNFEIQGEIDSTKGSLSLSNQMKANIFVRQTKTCNLITDVFSIKYNLNMQQSSFLEQNIETKTLNEKIDGNIVLDEDSAKLDRVLAVNSGNVIIKQTVINKETIQIEGVLVCNVIFKLDDEQNTIQSIFSEVPFNLSMNNEWDDNAGISIDIIPKEIEARDKKSKEIDILAEIIINLKVSLYKNNNLLQEISIGDERPEFIPIGVYIVEKAEDLWSISKKLLIDSKSIMEQNPDLTFPITTPQRIVIFRQRELL